MSGSVESQVRMKAKLTTGFMPGWSQPKPANSTLLDQLIAQFIQVCPIKSCSNCARELVAADFHKKRGKVNATCKDCVSKQKASRYKRKKVNRISASKRITKLIDLRKANVFETQISASTETSRLTELLQEIVIDIVTQTRQESGVEYGHQ